MLQLHMQNMPIQSMRVLVGSQLTKSTRMQWSQFLKNWMWFASTRLCKRPSTIYQAAANDKKLKWLELESLDIYIYIFCLSCNYVRIFLSLLSDFFDSAYGFFCSVYVSSSLCLTQCYSHNHLDQLDENARQTHHGYKLSRKSCLKPGVRAKYLEAASPKNHSPTRSGLRSPRQLP